MTTGDPDALARVDVAPDGMTATVTLPAELSREYLTVEFLAGLAREHRVAITQEVLESIEQVVRTFQAEPQNLSVVIARGTPAQHGEPARIEWEPECEPTRQADVPEDGPSNHYHVVDCIHVTEGQTIARLHPPTEGVDGINVRGEPVKAKPGSPLAWRLDPKSLEVVGSEVRSKMTGVILMLGRNISVSDLIEVQDVDFHTGNLTVEGGVHVRSEVKSRFEIHATKDVVIDGLVESAVIECGGNLHLRRGMAARDRGWIKVGGHAEVGYLNAVQARVEGDLIFHRELMNCQLFVGGSVVSRDGSIIGGSTAVTGSIHVGVLGSDAEIPTRIVLGTAPLLVEERPRLLRDVKRMETRIQELTEEQAMLTQGGGAITPAKKERLTELNYQIAEIRQQLTDVLTRLEQVERLQKRLRVDLLVRRFICPKVSLIVSGVEICFRKKLSGPIRIGLDSNRRLVVKRGDGSTGELGQYVSIRKAA